MAKTVPTKDDIVAARLIGRVLFNAARTLGIEHKEMGLQQLCERIVMAAQRGGLDPLSYQVVWTMMRSHGPH